ncbi:MAG TPA: hypothetical protein VFE47_15195 [Tepidisphaeraceae bacterium]|jgi:hypothetical protein|nr:hypothetical protein [Tepidisphaeraceae bacterium]
MFSRTALLGVSLLGLTLLTGCSPYVDGYYYAPHPAVAEIQATTTTTQPAQAPAPPAAPVTVYATVVGIRRENRDQHIPLSVEVRLRLDNHGQAAVTFDPHTLDLTTGDLVRFPPPVIAPPPVSLPPGQPVIVQANFPFPPGLSYDSVNVQNLQLRWAVDIEGHTVPQAAEFHRVYQYYDDPYWGNGPYWGYGYPYPYYGPYVGGRIVIRR